MSDEIAFGDLNSAVKGSAARACVGKAAWSFMPLCQIAELMERLNQTRDKPTLATLTNQLGWFQRTGSDRDALSAVEAGTRYLMHQTSCNFDEAMQQVIRVWEHGEEKYARFNWMKGMPWSEVINSGQRHVMKMYNGHELDDESGEHHAAHYICNAMMLLHYAGFYTEGNDLPCEWFQ